MRPRIGRLTLDLVEGLSADVPCRSCLHWELDAVRRAAVAPGDIRATKDAQLGEILREWGSCGRVALVEDRPVGWAIYGPAALLPGSQSLPTAPVSPDALLLTTVFVQPDSRGSGLGRMLVQAVAADLVDRGLVGPGRIAALEAFADTRGGGRCPGADGGTRGGAGLPEDFLAAVGFKTRRSHPTTPRMRMDLRATLRWREEVGQALDALVGAVRPRRRPRIHGSPARTAEVADSH